LLKQRHQFFVGLLAVADALTISAACLGAWSARLWVFDQPYPTDWESYFKDSLVLFLLPIGLWTMSAFGLYKPRRDRSRIGEQAQVFKSVVVMVSVLALSQWGFGSDFFLRGQIDTPNGEGLGWRLVHEPARLQIAVIFMLTLGGLAVLRLSCRSLIRSVRKRGFNIHHTAIIGDGRLGQIAAKTLTRNIWTGIRASYFISHHDEPRVGSLLGLPVVGGLPDLERVLEERPVDAVFLTLPAGCSHRSPELLKRLERFPVAVRIVPDIDPRYVPQSMSLNQLDGMPILSYRESPMHGLSRYVKRMLDLAGALFGIVLLSPLMLAIAVVIRRTSPGPVIFKQRRVSLGGEVFQIYKFRTMRHVDDEQPSLEWTSRRDPRITRFGAWLRTTSLDELPQLFNVVLGDMSLVGPRPERPELIERFRDDWRGYMIRQHVKAGMTGWAQVNGLRGDTSLRKRLQYDLFYIRNWSIWFDIRILFLTIFRGFVNPNAH